MIWLHVKREQYSIFLPYSSNALKVRCGSSLFLMSMGSLVTVTRTYVDYPAVCELFPPEIDMSIVLYENFLKVRSSEPSIIRDSEKLVTIIYIRYTVVSHWRNTKYTLKLSLCSPTSHFIEGF